MCVSVHCITTFISHTTCIRFADWIANLLTTTMCVVFFSPLYKHFFSLISQLSNSVSALKKMILLHSVLQISFKFNGNYIRYDFGSNLLVFFLPSPAHNCRKSVLLNEVKKIGLWRNNAPRRKKTCLQNIIKVRMNSWYVIWTCPLVLNS